MGHSEGQESCAAHVLMRLAAPGHTGQGQIRLILCGLSKARSAGESKAGAVGNRYSHGNDGEHKVRLVPFPPKPVLLGVAFADMR